MALEAERLVFLTALKRSSYDQDAQAPIISPLSTAEFRNLAGRAGRPGAAEGVEGMTLVALPQAPPTSAPGLINTQRRQLAAMNEDYQGLLDRLAEEASPAAGVWSPLAALLRLIAHHLQQLFGIQPGAPMLAWLGQTYPEAVTPAVGTSARTAHAQLADSLDELDGILLAAVEELSRGIASGLDGLAAEAFLRELWSRTFAQVAAARRPEFDAFLRQQVPAPLADDFIDPQLFLAWQRQLPHRDVAPPPAATFGAALTGTKGARQRYGVLPIEDRGGTSWFDAAGFALAHTQSVAMRGDAHRSDFELLTEGGGACRTQIRMARGTHLEASKGPQQASKSRSVVPNVQLS